MTVNGQLLVGVPDLQEWMIRIVLNEVNIAIHAWVDSIASALRIVGGF
jgi:hypothetical protein